MTIDKIKTIKENKNLIELEEEKFEKNFEKEKWMEVQGLYSSGN